MTQAMDRDEGTKGRRDRGSECRGVAPRKRLCFSVFLACVMLWHCGGCLNLASARHLAGFTEPKLVVKKTWNGFYAEAGTDFNGTIDATYDPATNAFTLKGQVNSNASGVITAEGERADHILELRKAEIAGTVEVQRLVGENFKAFGTVLALAAAGGGDAVAKVVDAAAPILKGSAANLSLVGLGAAGINLGAPTSGVPPAKSEEADKSPGS